MTTPASAADAGSPEANMSGREGVQEWLGPSPHVGLIPWDLRAG